MRVYSDKYECNVNKYLGMLMKIKWREREGQWRGEENSGQEEREKKGERRE